MYVYKCSGMVCVYHVFPCITSLRVYMFLLLECDRQSVVYSRRDNENRFYRAKTVEDDFKNVTANNEMATMVTRSRPTRKQALS